MRRTRQRGGRKHSDPYQRTGRHSLDGNERNKHFTGGGGRGEVCPISSLNADLYNVTSAGDNAVSGSSSNSSICALWDPLASIRPDLLRQDSDLESEAADPPDWRSGLTPDQLASLSGLLTAGLRSPQQDTHSALLNIQ